MTALVRLAIAVALMCFDHLVQSTFGILGVLFVLCLAVGIRTGNRACLIAAVVLFAALAIQAQADGQPHSVSSKGFSDPTMYSAPASCNSFSLCLLRA